MRFSLADLVDPRLEAFVEESRAFYAQRAARRGPASADELAALRHRAASTPTPASEPHRSGPVPAVEVVRSGGLRVPVRIHSPSGGAPRGALLDIHGGGFYLGSAADGDARNRALADATGLAVVSVDHRLAPENPWPAAPDDCEAAALWLAEHAASRFGTTRLAVAGFSAGATLATTTLLRLRDRGITAYAAGVLQFGTYDLSGQTPAGRLIADEYFLDAYAGALADRTHPHFSPAFADLAGLPPVLVVVGAEDVLLQDNLAMTVRLAAAGVAVDLRVYPASPHGFTGHPTAMARAALDDVEAWLVQMLSAAAG